MASGITIKVEGFDKVLRTVRQLGERVVAEVNLEFSAAADDIVAEAARHAPADEGGIRNAITKKKGVNGYEIVVQKAYAPFMEFGTKGKFKAPSEVAGYAGQFRNQKGEPGVNPVDALTGWVHRKGLARTGKGSQSVRERQVAFLIFRSIRKNGVKPHPFLFPAFLKERTILIDRIKNIIRQETQK